MTDPAPSASASLKRTPLYGSHLSLGARCSPFAGFEMPVFYSGIYEEAAAVRTACGVFDVSHMARLEFSEKDAPFLQRLLTCNVSAIRPGSGSYALVLNEEGGILDDVILYRRPAGKFLLVVNASNHEKIVRWIGTRTPAPKDITFQTAMLAVQGPDAEQILTRAVPQTGGPGDLCYFECAEMEWPGIGRVWISRTGYTGEDGFEVVSPAVSAENLWNWLTKVGRVTPCGLGARDVLRVEAGYSLYGSDMDESTSPYECGLGFAVASGVDFCGAQALKSRPVRRKLVGLDAGVSPSAVLRHGYPIFPADGGEKIGEITSGVYSKTLSRSIGFGSIRADLAEEAPLEVDVRGRRVHVRRTPRRFIQGRVKSRLS